MGVLPRNYCLCRHFSIFRSLFFEKIVVSFFTFFFKIFLDIVVGLCFLHLIDTNKKVLAETLILSHEFCLCARTCFQAKCQNYEKISDETVVSFFCDFFSKFFLKQSCLIVKSPSCYDTETLIQWCLSMSHHFRGIRNHFPSNWKSRLFFSGSKIFFEYYIFWGYTFLWSRFFIFVYLGLNRFLQKSSTGLKSLQKLSKFQKSFRWKS